MHISQIISSKSGVGSTIGRFVTFHTNRTYSKPVHLENEVFIFVIMNKFVLVKISNITEKLINSIRL